MTRELVILGAGSHASVIIDMIELTGGYTIVGLLDDYKDDQEHDGYGIMGTHDCLPELKHLHIEYFVCAVGENHTRKLLFESAIKHGLIPATIIHPSAQISPKAKIGDGTVIMANAVVNAYAFVGDNCIINTAATVDHHCVVSDHSHICPGVHLAGNVWVKSGAVVGIGTHVKPNGIVDSKGRIYDSA